MSFHCSVIKSYTVLAFSRDSNYVYYVAGIVNNPARTLYQVPVLGGASRKLNNNVTTPITLSPDGKLIACHYRDEQLSGHYKVAIYPFEGGQPVNLLDFPQNFVGAAGLRWTPDGRALTYIYTQNGVSNIWSLPLDGSPSKQITNFKSDQIFWFDFSRDGKQLAVSRGNISNDVVLITGFK